MDTSLPEPVPRRRLGIPIVGLGLVAWVVAVLAGAALVDPPAASRWYLWSRERWSKLVAAIASSSNHDPIPSESSSEPPVAPVGAPGPGGGGATSVDFVVQEQAEGGGGARPVATAPMTCEGAIRRYREAVLAGDAGPPRPIREDVYAATLQNGIYLRECEVADEVMVDVCAATRNGKIIGVTVQTSPHRPQVARCLAQAVRSLEVEETSPELDVSHAHFDPRWR